MVFWGPSVIPILVFHNTSRQMICMLIVCNRQSQGTSWWEACWNNGSQGLWIQELGLSSIDHWFWHPAGKAHCWSPFTPQTWPVTFFWQSNGLMANKKFHVSDVLFDCTLSSCLETLQRCAATQVLDLLHSFRDVQHLGTWHLVDLCTHVQSHYPGCIEKLFMVNVPLIFYGVWKVASPFIKDAVRKKVGDWIWAFTPKSSQKKLWISETRLHHVCCRFKVWYLWKEYNPCSAQQALDQYLQSGHETEVHSVPTWRWTVWLNVVVQIVFVDNKKLQETLLHDIDADQLCSEYGGSGDLILLQDVVQFLDWWPLSCIKSKE